MASGIIPEGVKITPTGGMSFTAVAGRDSHDPTMYHDQPVAIDRTILRSESRQKRLDLEAKRKERETDKYEHGVSQITNYFSEGGMSTAHIDAYLTSINIDLPPGPDDTAEAYARKAAELVFHETRVSLFGKSAVAKAGGETSAKALGGIGIPGVNRVIGKWREFGLKRQVRITRNHLVSWKKQMDESQDAYYNAKFSAAYLVNQNRLEVQATPMAGESLVSKGADALQDLLNTTQQGELVNPLLTVFGGLLKQQKGPDGEDLSENARSEGLGEKIRGQIKAVTDGIRLPTELLPMLVNSDTRISVALESVAGILSKTPDAVFRAREGLLDLQAYATAISRLTGGRVNIERRINLALRRLTGGQLVTLSVASLLGATEAMSAVYVVEHPEKGLEKMSNDARRTLTGLGGETWQQRVAAKAAMTAMVGTMGLFSANLREEAKTDREAWKTAGNTAAASSGVIKDTGPGMISWWRGIKRFNDWRAHKGRVKEGGKLPTQINLGGESTNNDTSGVERAPRYDSQTTEQLVQSAREKAQQLAEQKLQQQSADASETANTEVNAQQLADQEAKIRAQEAVDKADVQLRAAAMAFLRRPTDAMQATLDAAQASFDMANSSLQDILGSENVEEDEVQPADDQSQIPADVTVSDQTAAAVGTPITNPDWAPPIR